ncbi:MAG: LysR family transcriptional regulator [Oceanospirillaceae bacterium]|nr:LysR family transcriptional regulator [Oceanospirillaceae bacterium]
MDRLHQMQVFVAVADAQGFAPAARKLGLSPPAVTRAIAALELELGVTLLHRTTRRVRLTDTGQRYLDDVRRILAEIEAADASAMGQNAEPRGTLTVTAPVLFGRIHVLPVITEYLNRYPDVTVNALFLDRVVGLVEEGIDVAVRIGHLPDSSDRALKVGDIRSLLVASPGYLARNGVPDNPDQLADHNLIASTAGAGRGGYWRFYRRRVGDYAAVEQRVMIEPRLTVTTNDSAIEAAVAGLGITRINSYQIHRHLMEGALTVLLTEFEPPSRPVQILHREMREQGQWLGQLGQPGKTRAFIDVLAQRLRDDLMAMTKGSG